MSFIAVTVVFTFVVILAFLFTVAVEESSTDLIIEVYSMMIYKLHNEKIAIVSEMQRRFEKNISVIITIYRYIICEFLPIVSLIQPWIYSSGPCKRLKRCNKNME